MRFDCLERRLAGLFAAYARIVSRWPAPFILLPLLLSSILLFGLIRTPSLIKDDLSLYTPNNAPALGELRDLSTTFPINDSDSWYFERRYDANRAGYIIVTTHPEGGNVLTEPVLRAAVKLWDQITHYTVPGDGRRLYNYSGICVQIPNGRGETKECIANPLLHIFPKRPQILEELRYPVTSFGWYLGHFVGGVRTNRTKHVVDAKALLLPYQLRHSTVHQDEISGKWELALIELMETYRDEEIEASCWTSETLSEESAKDRSTLLSLLVPLFVVVTLFTLSCCFVGSWVRSRPWLGLGGVISAALAILSSIGALLLSGQKFTSVAYCMPFIIFSIAVDNVFILLGAWRKSPGCLRFNDRMALTFRDAGVSITVTSLTDGISFGVGCMTTFPSVRIFCLYAGVSIAFVYVYQLTFFAGIMALTGRREVEGRHCLTFQKVKAKKKKPPSDGWSGSGIGAPWSNGKQNEIKGVRGSEALEANHSLARFFRNGYATFLLNPWTRLLVLIAFMVYIGFAIYGCTKLKIGLEPINLLPQDSYGRRTLTMFEDYFSENGAYLHVWITNLSDIDSNRRIWVPLMKEIELYEHTEFTGYSDCWLRVFLAFVRAAGLLLTPDNFTYILKNIFLSTPQYEKYSRDIVFDDMGQKLTAVRFPIHLRYVGMTNQSRAMQFFRRLAGNSEFPVQVYSDFFRFAEQYDAVLPATLLNVGVAGASVIIVSLLLIPEPICAVWVSLTIFSINIGILGLMSMWSVHLDFVSSLTILMSIGFCVDFSAHIAYHFAKENRLKTADRLRAALYAVGTPIIQSAASTILGVSFLLAVDSYVFRSFLKTIVLVILLGTFHGLVVLPILLTLFSCSSGGSGTEEYSQSDGTGTTRTIGRDDLPPPDPRPNYIPHLRAIPTQPYQATEPAFAGKFSGRHSASTSDDFQWLPDSGSRFPGMGEEEVQHPVPFNYMSHHHHPRPNPAPFIISRPEIYSNVR